MVFIILNLHIKLFGYKWAYNIRSFGGSSCKANLINFLSSIPDCGVRCVYMKWRGVGGPLSLAGHVPLATLERRCSEMALEK